MPSGAKIIVLDDVVIKTNGDGRIDEQAAWLERYKSRGVVKVLGTWHGGYAMERLDEVDRPVTPEDVIRMLTAYVWINTPQVMLDWNAVSEYAATKSKYWVEGGEAIKKRIAYLSTRTDFMSARVHGDPTFENVMRRGDDLVLIDPIPGRSYAPDILGVDLGKILQSCCGYEAVLAGDAVVAEPDISWLADFEPVDRDLAILFGLIHVCRFMPYLPVDMRIKMRETVGANMLCL